jgi:hypothetical protein
LIVLCCLWNNILADTYMFADMDAFEREMSEPARPAAKGMRVDVSPDSITAQHDRVPTPIALPKATVGCKEESTFAAIASSLMLAVCVPDLARATASLPISLEPSANVEKTMYLVFGLAILCLVRRFRLRVLAVVGFAAIPAMVSKRPARILTSAHTCVHAFHAYHSPWAGGAHPYPDRP